MVIVCDKERSTMGSYWKWIEDGGWRNSCQVWTAVKVAWEMKKAWVARTFWLTHLSLWTILFILSLFDFSSKMVRNFAAVKIIVFFPVMGMVVKKREKNCSLPEILFLFALTCQLPYWEIPLQHSLVPFYKWSLQLRVHACWVSRWVDCNKVATIVLIMCRQILRLLLATFTSVKHRNYL